MYDLLRISANYLGNECYPGYVCAFLRVFGGKDGNLLVKKYIGLCLLGLILLFASCGKNAEPLFAGVEDARSLAAALYSRAGFETDGMFTEVLDRDSAYVFGMSGGEFDKLVKSAVVCRRAVDTSGQTLYVLEMDTADAAALWAENFYNDYEWAACDNAEKLTVACAGNYLVAFKSNEGEVRAMDESFRALSGNRVLYRRELVNKG